VFRPCSRTRRRDSYSGRFLRVLGPVDHEPKADVASVRLVFIGQTCSG